MILHRLKSVGVIVLSFVLLCIVCCCFLSSQSRTVLLSDKLLVFITVDVETPFRTEPWHPFEHPVFLTGEGLPGEPGVNLIMALLEKYRFKGNFFLDVYEHRLYRNPNVMKNVARSITARGHELDLHCHAMRLSGKDLVEYPLPEQVKILRYGKDLIEQWTGNPPVAFRAGAYLLDDDTLKALESVHIPIDSSVFFANHNNHFKTPFTRNSAARYGRVIELPITVARYSKKHNIVKLDLDWLGYDDLTAIVQEAERQKAKKLVFMMHSFSLIKFKRDGTSMPLKVNGRKVEKFDRFLNFLATDPHVEVVTYEDWYQRNRLSPDIAHLESEFMPVLR
jgi:peptidoglycan/xylan/chitin deacetylase (PgdA/CDA1 family)